MYLIFFGEFDDGWVTSLFKIIFELMVFIWIFATNNNFKVVNFAVFAG